MTTEQPDEHAVSRPVEIFGGAHPPQEVGFTSAAVTGFSTHFFRFFQPVGAGLPPAGTQFSQTNELSFPEGSSLIFALTGFDGNFVDDSGTELRAHTLGVFSVDLSFRAPNLLVCKVRLNTGGGANDSSILVRVSAVVLYF